MANQSDKRDQTLKRYLSPSQIGMYARCPAMYEQRYINGLKYPPGIAAHVGGGVHEAISTNFFQKIKSFEDLPQGDFVMQAVEEFDKRVEDQGIMLSADQKEIGEKKIIGVAKDDTANFARFHHATIAPGYQPKFVEKEVRVTVPGSTHDLLGILDLATDQDQVVDFKHTGRKKPAGEADKMIQLTVYAITYNVVVGHLPSEILLDVAINKKSGQERQIQKTIRTAADIQAFVHRFNAVTAAINAGNFPPCDPTSWCCSKKWCGYYEICPYVP